MRGEKIIIRADGNSNIGLGHIYRGIALAEMLKDRFSIEFVTKSDTTISPIVNAKHKHQFLPENITLMQEPIWFKENYTNDTIIILDGYSFSENYQQKIKELDFQLVYIDDLAQGTQKADLVINHSPGIKVSDYKKEQYTKLALGLDYAILRESFITFDRKVVKEKQFDTILVSFGGADPVDFTKRSVEQLLKIKNLKQVYVILGAAYKHKAIFNITSPKLKIYNNLDEREVVKLMSDSDIALVPASNTSIELASIGVPMLLGYFVENQIGIYNGFIEKNGAIPIGDFNKKDFSKLSTDIDQYLKKGITQIFKSNPKNNIKQLFISNNLNVRTVKEQDLEFAFDLSNENLVRENSYNSEPIVFENHKKWFKKQLEENRNLYYILEQDSIPLGQIRFTEEKSNSVIGVSISNKYRGKGLATKGLKLATKEYFKSNNLPIYAYIKKTNIASLKAFENAGFKFLKNEMVKGIDSFLYIKEKRSNENSKFQYWGK